MKRWLIAELDESVLEVVVELFRLFHVPEDRVIVTDTVDIDDFLDDSLDSEERLDATKTT